MRRIISASRRTDIPAFYGDWFMARVKEGFAGIVYPFGGRKYIVSLRPQDVTCFVFWSKNFTPFIENLKTLDALGYTFYFNYTVTGLPAVFESNVDRRSAIVTLKRLSEMYSPAHINWRFDPIIISNICGRDYFLEIFEKLASELAGFVERCYVSFVTEYGKVTVNFDVLRKTGGVQVIPVGEEFKIELANELAAIAGSHGIQMYSCCGDYLLGEKIKKAHCIDGKIIEELFFPEGLPYRRKPTRKQCGCTESTDIGTYDTCPHGCVYCYANANKTRAYTAYRNHDKDSAFLGYRKADSDRWLVQVMPASRQDGDTQRKMF